MNAHIQLKHLLPAWETFRRATDIAPIRDETHYRRMVAMLDALLDETAGDEGHPAMGLVDIVGDLIADYGAAHHPLPSVSGVQTLKFLMEQHGLKQADLREIAARAWFPKFWQAIGNSIFVKSGLSANASEFLRRPSSEAVTDCRRVASADFLRDVR